MSSLKNVKTSLEKYHNNYRNERLEKFVLSGLYDLFPDENKQRDEEVTHGWYKQKADKWPNYELPGIYFIFDAKLELLYIGKASNNNNIGKRLQKYFKYGKNRECEIIDTWGDKKPRYVATLGFSSEVGFQASSLEEFLINDLKPVENKVGNIK